VRRSDMLAAGGRSESDGLGRGLALLALGLDAGEGGGGLSGVGCGPGGGGGLIVGGVGVARVEVRQFGLLLGGEAYATEALASCAALGCIWITRNSQASSAPMPEYVQPGG
jgi:hypothetical protein